MDATEYLLWSPANRERLLRSMGQVDTVERIITRDFYQPATTDDPHRILAGEGEWLLETESHVGDD